MVGDQLEHGRLRANERRRLLLPGRESQESRTRLTAGAIAVLPAQK